MFNFNTSKILVLIISLTIVTRLLYTLIFVNLASVEYYEYGNIALNMHYGNGYSLFYFEDHKIEYRFNPAAKPYKSAYMPAGYIFYLYPFFYIKNVEVRNLFIILSQILISCIVVYLIFRLTNVLFDKYVAIITSIIVAILPEFIYASCSIQVTIFYHLFIISILLILETRGKGLLKIFLMSLLFSISIYFRNEILLFAILIAGYFVYKNEHKKVVILLSTIILLFLPWQIRNYCTFNEIVPLTTSSGLNFYRGHNPYEIGAWGDESTEEYLYSIKEKPDFETQMNKMYFNKAIESIKENPLKEISYPFFKLFHLFLFYPQDKRVFNMFYLLPWFLLLGFSIHGFIVTFSWKRFNYIYLFVFYTCLIGIVFFVLPRYQTMMKIILIPFAGYSIKLLLTKLKRSFQSYLN